MALVAWVQTRREAPLMSCLVANRPPPLRFGPFVAKLEEAQAEGRPDLIAANMPRLARLIPECMEWQVKIAELEQRARIVRDRHEPRARPERR